jgi:hypothetical protein
MFGNVDVSVVNVENIDSKESFVGLLQSILDQLEQKNKTIEDLMSENSRLSEIKSNILDMLDDC